MVRRLCCAALAVGLAGCAAQSGPGPSAGSDGAAYTRLVQDGFRPNEYVKHQRVGALDPRLLKGRYGYTDEGQEYRYYNDGSGSVRDAGTNDSSGWTVECLIDSMTDRRKCSIKNRALFITFGFGAAPLGICIREHDYPGRTGLIRIDDAQPVPTDRDGCVEGAAIVNRAVAARRIRFRYVHWPYDNNRNGEASARGLRSAVLLVGHMRSKLGSLSFD
jgi:hypothetical protein